MAEELTPETFEAKAKSGKVLIDFWAPWCAPCRMMAPEFIAASKEADDDIAFYKVNTDEYPALAGPFGIRGIPTVVFLKDGEEVHRFSGARPKDAILDEVKKAF